jgi:hypothetical protein
LQDWFKLWCRWNDQTNKHQIRQKSDIKFDLGKSELNEEQKEILTQFLNQNRDVFATNLQELGKTSLYKHTIDTGDSKCRPDRTSPAAKQEIQRQIDEMLTNGIIEHSTSEYSFPIVLVKKKNGEFRFAIDYRKLNAVTQPVTHPLPRLDDVFDVIGQANVTIYTNLDLTSAYFQLGLYEKSKQKTAFITHDNLYQFKRMSYGLKNTCQSFQALMNQLILRPLSALSLDEVNIAKRNITTGLFGL